MKKLIRNTDPKYYITVTIYKVESKKVAAEQYLQHLKTIPESRKISDEELQELNDLIMSVMSVFKVNNFKILPGHQSSDGYTWYAPFYPVLDTGELLDEYVVSFRISNHPNKGITEGTDESVLDYDKMTILKSFTLGTPEYPSIVSILRAVKDLCINIKYVGYDAITTS